MEKLIVMAVGLVALAFVFELINAATKGGGRVSRKMSSSMTASERIYKYEKRRSLMTASERQCYAALVAAVGETNYVFAQVRLSSLVDHTIRGQDWRAALAHINQKSVDFVLCDKTNVTPVLAIELDDRSHFLPHRMERDRTVERVLNDAGIPLLRLPNPGPLDPAGLLQKIKDALLQPHAESEQDRSSRW